MSDKSMPYPDDPGQTHYPGCYRERGHHNCAVMLVDNLRAELAEYKPILLGETNDILE